MKQFFVTITIVLGGLILAQPLCAQESLRDRLARRQNQQQRESLPQLTIRAENMNQAQTQDIENAPWMREIYRFLDLNKEKNAPLYYPATPIGDRMNLFTMMFKLLANNEITAYEFQLDRVETFTEDNKLNFKDLLDRFGVMYTEENGKFIIEEADIPSNEVLGYYVKEAWYFDKSNSVVDNKTLAICPVIFSQGDFDGETSRYPLFWLPYEQIRPYASRMPIMISNLNNASTQTIDDYFRKRNFEGEIYKTTNMKNLALAQIYPDNDSLVKKEQKKIETQLKGFKERLWAMDNTTDATEKVAVKKTKEETTESTEEKATGKASNTDTKVRTNEPKKTKSSSTPARSMRNRRR